MRPIIILLFALLTFSCADLKPKEVDLYFDIKSVLIDQSASLKQDNVELHKLAVVNGDSSSNSFVPDSLGWADEFQIISDADINKPALRRQYSISEQDDDNSNLKIQTYTAEKEDLVTQSLKIYYLDKIENLKKIEILQKQTNSIFKSTKTITIHFDEIQLESRIISYVIEGHQKMILQDRVDFNIKGSLQH
jgi:hypothetical protein